MFVLEAREEREKMFNTLYNLRKNFKRLTYDLILVGYSNECFANETSVRCAKKRVLRMQQCLDNKERR